MLNAQPMGFYSPGYAVEDAKRHGVLVRRWIYGVVLGSHVEVDGVMRVVPNDGRITYSVRSKGHAPPSRGDPDRAAVGADWAVASEVLEKALAEGPSGILAMWLAREAGHAGHSGAGVCGGVRSYGGRYAAGAAATHRVMACARGDAWRGWSIGTRDSEVDDTGSPAAQACGDRGC